MAYTKEQTQIKKALLEKGFTKVKMNQYNQFEVEYLKHYTSKEEIGKDMEMIKGWIREVCPDFQRVGSGTIISPKGTKTIGLYYHFYAY